MFKRVARGLGIGAAAALVAFALHALGVLEPLEWKSWDLRTRLLGRPASASHDIVLILIDQTSLDEYEKSQSLPWPWPRQMYVALVDYLKAGGAKAVFFDLILSEGSRYGVEDDQIFSKAVSASGDVFIPFFLSAEVKDKDPEAIRALRRFALPREAVPGNSAVPLPSVSLPVDTILQAAAGSGNVRFAPDDDGIYRRIPLAFSYESLILPSLPLAMVRFIERGFDPAGVHLDRTGRMIIRFHGPTGTYKAYSAAAVINSWARMDEGKTPQIDPKEFAGKTVLVGTNAPGLLDLRPTPWSSEAPGTEIQAAALDNLMNGDSVRMPSVPARIFYGLGLALLVAVAVSVSKRIWKIALILIGFIAVPAAAAAAAFRSGIWLDFVGPETAVVLGFVGASLLNYSQEGRQKRFIKTVFRHYLSPDVIERILENPSLLDLGGEKREITALFSDVAGFTSVSEKLSPEALVELLNQYLSEMTDIILSTGGTLDKYEGDAIIAFWNAPLDQPDHPLRAVRAALRCQNKLTELRPGLMSKYGSQLFARIGINSGPAVVGNMGSRKRFDYTAMGDTMNLASRLEGACKMFGVWTLVSETTRNMIEGWILTREIDMIRVVGKKRPVRVYEPIAEIETASPADHEKIARFQAGLEAYRKRDWSAAADIFKSIEDDRPAVIYLQRCLVCLESPPPEDWDGVFELKEK